MIEPSMTKLPALQSAALLCRDQNNIEVGFTLRGMNKPMRVSEYSQVEALPDNLKGAMPTVEEIENDLQQLKQQKGEFE
jgi:hypothetical protein